MPSLLADADVLDEWPLPQLATHDGFEPTSITYMGDEGLLASDPNSESIWLLDDELGTASPWVERPQYGMLPYAVRYVPTDGGVFVASRAGQSRQAGDLPSRFMVLEPSGSLRVRWPAREGNLPQSRSGDSSHLAVLPSGEIAWLVGSANEDPRDRVQRMDLNGQRSVSGHCPRAYDRMAVDDAGRFYLLSKQLQPGAPRVEIDTVDDGCTGSTPFLDPEGARPYRGHDFAIAGWPAKGRLFLGNDLMLTAFTTSGEALYNTYVPQLCLRCPADEIAPRPNSAFAMLMQAAESDGPALTGEPHHTQVVQFGSDGEPYARTVFRSADVPLMWRSGRIAVTSDEVHILYPDSDLVASFSLDGQLLRSADVVSWAADIGTSGNDLVVKGSSGRSGSVQRLDTQGRAAWTAACPCDESQAVSANREHILISNARTGRVEALSTVDGRREIWMEPSDSTGRVALDLASSASHHFLLDGAAGVIQVLDDTGQVLKTINPGPLPHRLDATNDGRLAVLDRRGGIQVYDPAGDLTHTISLSGTSVTDTSLVTDLAWSASEDIFVLDAQGPVVKRVRVPEAAPATPVPTPEHADSPGICRHRGAKSASPERVVLGDVVTLTLSLSIECPVAQRRPVDLMIVLNGNYRGGQGGEPREYNTAAFQIAERLADYVDMPTDRVAVAQQLFGVHQDFTSEIADVRRAVRRVGRYWGDDLPSDATSYRGLAWAIRHMENHARTDADRIIVHIAHPIPLLSAEAGIGQLARDADAQLILVYWPIGGDLPEEYADSLKQMVEDESDLINLEDALATDALLERVARLRYTGAISDIRVEDKLGDTMRLIDGSARPSGHESPRVVSWTSASYPVDGLNLTVRVQPSQVGRWPTNGAAHADYTDSEGYRRRVTFPIPVVDVVAPTATDRPLPTRTPTPVPAPTEPTPSPTSVQHQSVYLPISLLERCDTSIQRQDTVIVVDTSSSMSDPTQTGRSKIEAATEAALHFLALLDLERGDQAAVVHFDREARLTVPLTDEIDTLQRGLRSWRLGETTCLPCAVDQSLDALRSARRRTGSAPVIVLLTDGLSNPRPASEAVERAAEAKAEGVVIHTIGLGDTLDFEALKAMASRPDDFHRAPDGEDLAAIYEQIAVEIPCPPSRWWGRR